MAILRWDFQPGDAPEMIAKEKPTWTPKPISNGSENVLLIAVLPSPRSRARRSTRILVRHFSELTKMVSVIR
jgi:hypothetical protein